MDKSERTTSVQNLTFETVAYAGYGYGWLVVAGGVILEYSNKVSILLDIAKDSSILLIDTVGESLLRNLPQSDLLKGTLYGGSMYLLQNSPSELVLAGGQYVLIAGSIAVIIHHLRNR
jgi:hypothetical protein